MNNTILLLEDGKIFRGKGFGATGTAIGEVVFNTGMTGYQEILTDPSYKGQLVTLTYPHIGNTGINEEDMESVKPHLEGFIVRDYCNFPSNYRSRESLGHYMKRNGICGIHQIDTRKLTRHIREKGSMMGIFSSEGLAIKELKGRFVKQPDISEHDLVQDVTIQDVDTWETDVDGAWYYETIQPLMEQQLHIAVYDFVIKQNILRIMASLGFQITRVPASMPAEAVEELEPDGIFLSNGPGDPESISYAIKAIQKLVNRYPIFGICLGHQILGLALGAETFKLKFGHHGSNHPVRHTESGKVEITAQNHNFALFPESLKSTGFEITHLNLNDGTVEGMQHKEKPIFSVQYHPEASPGPHDSIYLFRQFYRMMNSAS